MPDPRMYITRGKKPDRCGILIAIKSDKPLGFSIGWSLCNKKDKFCKYMGLAIAYGRAEIGSKVNIPYSILNFYQRFLVRCGKYYKRDITT